jgi:hypothetical protein
MCGVPAIDDMTACQAGFYHPRAGPRPSPRRVALGLVAGERLGRHPRVLGQRAYRRVTASGRATGGTVAARSIRAVLRPERPCTSSDASRALRWAVTVARAITVGLLLPKPFLSRKPRLHAAFESRNQQHGQDRGAAYDGGVSRCAIGATMGVRWPARRWKMAISPGSQWLATGGSDGTVRIWDAATGRR